MTDEIELPPVLDLVAASGLLENILERRGQNLLLNGAAVQRLGGQCLQVLLAARATWAADEQVLRLQNLSEDFIASLELMGLSPEDLMHHAEAKSEETKQ